MANGRPEKSKTLRVSPQRHPNQLARAHIADNRGAAFASRGARGRVVARCQSEAYWSDIGAVSGSWNVRGPFWAPPLAFLGFCRWSVGAPEAL
eukprot:6609594-Pyramimonas_sp.AAC.1